MSKGYGLNTLSGERNLPDWAVHMNQLAARQIPFLFVLDFELLRPVVIPLSEVTGSGIRYALHSMSAVSVQPQEIFFNKYPVSFNRYQEGFDKVMDAIQAGDTYLLNLSYATRLSGVPSLDIVFNAVKAPYKLYVPGSFVVFSPEQFVSVSDGIIRTYPMKGTIDASIADAQNVLLADIKEQEEHATVVDLLRNDLSIVASRVTVERYRYISTIHTDGKTLLQCSSEISGHLDDGYAVNIGNLMYSLLPAGSVTGAPKKRTVELIKEIEPEPRGYYTGVFGVFDGKNLDSGVMIRMIEERKDGYFYRSGGGITYRSIAELEYQEMLDKVYIPR